MVRNYTSPSFNNPTLRKRRRNTRTSIVSDVASQRNIPLSVTVGQRKGVNILQHHSTVYL